MRDVTRGPAPTEHDARPLGKRPDQLLHYDDLRVPRPPVAGINVQCRLKHFAIISYTVDPALLRPMIPQRFRLDTIMIDGREQALVSAVPFLNVDFGLAAHPSPGWKCRRWITAPTLLMSIPANGPSGFSVLPWTPGPCHCRVTSGSSPGMPDVPASIADWVAAANTTSTTTCTPHPLGAARK